MMTFNTGDRVMVTQFESPYSCDLNGFYGRVTGKEEMFIFVQLEGCLDTAPDRDEFEYLFRDDPFPFLAKELEHAD
jgi:hypothetical protein